MTIFEIAEIPDENSSAVAVKVNLSRATLKEASDFKNYLEELIKDEPKDLIVDLNSCEYIDSSFLGALVSILKRLNNLNKSFKIVLDHNSDLYNSLIFSITKMNKIFSVFNTLEEACEISD